MAVDWEGRSWELKTLRVEMTLSSGSALNLTVLLKIEPPSPRDDLEHECMLRAIGMHAESHLNVKGNSVMSNSSAERTEWRIT